MSVKVLRGRGGVETWVDHEERDIGQGNGPQGPGMGPTSL